MVKVLCIALFIMLSVNQADSQIVQSPVSDQLYPLQSAKVEGYIGNKLDLSYKNRILAQDYERLIAPFNNRTEASCWQSEFWGKWFTSAVLAYKYRPWPNLKNVLDKAVA